MRNRLVSLACLVILSAWVVPAAVFGQTSGSQPPPQKKKATKVWTNDDFAERAPEPAKEEEKKPEAAAKPSAVAELEAQLQQLRETREADQKVLDQGPKQIQVFEEKIAAASDPREQEAYRDTITAIEKAIAESQANIQGYDAKIAELEKQLKAAQRREAKKKKPEAKPATPPPG